MAGQPVLERSDVLAMLAELAGRPAGDVPDRIGSMELAWLVHQVEQRYGQLLDLTDDQLAGIRTVSDAVDVLRAALGDRTDG